MSELADEDLLVRRLPIKFNQLPIVVSPDAQLKYMRPGLTGFDEKLLNAAFSLIKSGANVWDIGANVGVFTIAAAAQSRSGQIVAVEADTWLVDLMRKTTRLPENRQFDISVVPAAAFSSFGIAKFAIAMRGRASSHLEVVPGNTQSGGTREVMEVVTIPLDLLLSYYNLPDVVKIDVEGAEVEVLKGMTKILTEVRPDLYCEVNRANGDEFLAILNEFDYVPMDIDTRLEEEEFKFNMLYAPKEKLGFQGEVT